MSQRYFLILFVIIALLWGSCNEKDINQEIVTNPNYKLLNSPYELKEIDQIKFPLDSISAPKVEYIQLVREKSGQEILSFFNKNNKSIYFYDYKTQWPLKTIKIGSDSSSQGKIDPAGFYVESYDTIYIYNRRNIELLCINSYGNILHKISLIANSNIRGSKWFLKYPQYHPQGSNPIMEINGQLLFPGQLFESLQDSLIQQFHFVSYIDEKSNEVQFYHQYIDSLYGHNYNWSGEKFTEVYLDWNPEKQKLIFSFPISHNLYVARLKDNSYATVNGASTQSLSISSIPVKTKKMKIKELVRHVLESDEYGPVRYDPYRKVYYRFLRQGIKNYTLSSQWGDKEISIILLDEDFKYLGETNIGKMKNWYIQNAFVNEKGLHIEYIPNVLNEDFLTYKIFKINKK